MCVFSTFLVISASTTINKVPFLTETIKSARQSYTDKFKEIEKIVTHDETR